MLLSWLGGEKDGRRRNGSHDILILSPRFLQAVAIYGDDGAYSHLHALKCITSSACKHTHILEYISLESLVCKACSETRLQLLHCVM